MNKILVVNNPHNSSEVAESVCAFLERKGVSFSSINAAEIKSADNINEILNGVDMAVTIGGDGTILSVGRLLVGKKIPIFGINTGHLGYLTTTEPKDAAASLTKVLENNYVVEKRITLAVKIKNKVYTCLNEAAFHRGELPHLLKVKTEINGSVIDVIRGDGVLIATPTGSTAYNLSAGGPVIVPTANNMVFTPICAHSLTARPIVLASNDKVKITVENTDCNAKFSADGINTADLKQGESAEITIGKEKLLLVRTGEKNFYEILRRKLSEK